MKMVKSLILGSAAGLVVMSGAQAADLPVKAKAVEYVRICSLYGAGFYYIPGTDTCIKLGGYLRADVVFNTNTDNTGNVSGPGGSRNRFTNYYTTRSRADLSIDTRTATEYGVVRTFADVVFTWTGDSYGNNGAVQGSTVYSPLGGVGAPYVTTSGGAFAPGSFGTNPAISPASAPNNANAGGVAAGTLGVYYAFVQFAGFTFGKAISQFSTSWSAYPGNTMFDGLVGGGGTVTGVNQLTYTTQLGNGVSLTLSAQDQTAYYQAGVQNLSAAATVLTPALGVTPTFAGTFGASNYGGTTVPDLVASLKVDQAWGMFQLSAAAHNNHAAYYGGPTLAAGISGTELAGHPDDKWGWAIQGALQIKNIPTGAGDSLNVQAVYTDGATRYNIQDLAAAYGAVALFGGSSNPAAYQSIALNLAPDTVFVTGGAQQSIKTWGTRGAFNHNWDPYWSSSLYGAYAAVRYDDASKVSLCSLSPWTLAAGTTTCNPDYNILQLGANTRWTPVKNLTFTGEVTWSHIDQKNEGVTTALSNSVTFPVGKPIRPVAYEWKDQSNLILGFRAQRNF
jgi:hypothetical protein